MRVPRRDTSKTCRRPWSILVFVSLTFILAAGVTATAAESQEKSTSLAENRFIMAANRPEDSPVYIFWNLFYTEVFKRIGIQFELRYYPMKRATVELDKGRVDGEPVRIYSYADTHPNLRRVDESVYSMNVVAYATKSSISDLNGWESLRGRDYRVEYPRGMKISQDNLSKVVETDKLSEISEASQALKKLIANRIDVYIDDDIVITPLLRNPEFKKQGKIRTVGIMESVPLYMYVHKKHESVIPQLMESIRAVKAEGLVEHYHEIAFGVSNEVHSSDKQEGK